MMDRDITESITSIVKVKLYDKNKNVVFEGEGMNTGFEVVGHIEQFYTK